MAPSDDVASFREALGTARQIGIIAGSGLSVASGIPTYRGVGGLWKKYNINTLDSFQADPCMTWLFYHHLRESFRPARPNDGHRALASFNIPSVLSRIAPACAANNRPPLLITQNIDGLSVDVLTAHPDIAPNARKDNVIQMHGELYRTTCTSCRHSKEDRSSPICSALGGTEEIFANAKDSADLPQIPVDRLPRCGGDQWSGSNRYGKCGGLLRPEVVWFGEVPYVGEISRFLAHCDLLLVVGTSSLVHPAASFAAQIKRQGGKVAVFNLDKSQNDQESDYLFLGPCDETLPEVLGVKEEVASWPRST